MIDTNLEMTDKIGYLLFKKGIIDEEILEKAINAKTDDKGKVKRNLAQVLVHDFGFDHDTIFREVAILYAFRELDTSPDETPEERLNNIKNTIENADVFFIRSARMALEKARHAVSEVKLRK